MDKKKEFQKRLDEIGKLSYKVNKDCGALIKEVLDFAVGKRIDFDGDTVSAICYDGEGNGTTYSVEGVWLDDGGRVRYITDYDDIYDENGLEYRDYMNMSVDKELLLEMMIDNI